VLEQATGTWTHLTHHCPNSREATTFPHIVFSAALYGGYIQMVFFPGTPKEESRNYPGLESWVGVAGFWELISPGSDLWLEWGLNQSCSSPRDLFNAMSHSFRRRREEVDSWLLVVGSQTANLTPGPSFAHNLGCTCPNGTCEAILGIYTSRTFHWYKEHFNARCFDPWIWALSFRESRRTPTSHFWGCEFHPHTYPKSGVAIMSLEGKKAKAQMCCEHC